MQPLFYIFFLCLTFFLGLNTINADNCAIKVGDFRTQTQGGWAAKAEGNNPGVYRDSHFAQAFPSGILIGKSSANHLIFTNSAAISKYLPAGGSPRALTASQTNPTKSLGGLSGQTLALSLSVGFDFVFSDFGSSPYPLHSLVLTTGYCSGMTVGQVLEACNSALSGENPSADFSSLSTCADMINKNFVDGTRNSGALVISPLSSLSLPPSLTFSITSTLGISDSDMSSYFTVALNLAPGTWSIGSGSYRAWCVDFLTGIYPDWTDYFSRIYSSVDPQLSTKCPRSVGKQFNAINYILNNRQNWPEATAAEFQVAIWRFSDNPDPTTFSLHNNVVFNDIVVQQIISDTSANGLNFVPSSNQTVALILDDYLIYDNSAYLVQLLIVEHIADDCALF